VGGTQFPFGGLSPVISAANSFNTFNARTLSSQGSTFFSPAAPIGTLETGSAAGPKQVLMVNTDAASSRSNGMRERRDAMPLRVVICAYSPEAKSQQIPSHKTAMRHYPIYIVTRYFMPNHRRKAKLTDKYIVKRYNNLMQVDNASGGRLVSAGIERLAVPATSITGCSPTNDILGGVQR
jgi:hypothetical protein